MAQEWVALAYTIKVLNDGDTMEFFKRTLPSAKASLLHIEGGQRSSAVVALRAALAKSPTQDKPAIELLLLALTGQSQQIVQGSRMSLR